MAEGKVFYIPGQESIRRIECEIDGHKVSFSVLDHRIRDGELLLSLPAGDEPVISGGIMGLVLLNPRDPGVPLSISSEAEGLIRRILERHLENRKRREDQRFKEEFEESRQRAL